VLPPQADDLARSNEHRFPSNIFSGPQPDFF